MNGRIGRLTRQKNSHKPLEMSMSFKSKQLLEWFSSINVPVYKIKTKKNFEANSHPENNEACCPICLDTIQEAKKWLNYKFFELI